ncbi:MAG: hypothetical protein IJO52_07250 [Clostridia bacterium]|nr:hypothetical protein [Clostridia bacterium]MBQ9921967.1 hypothetical protein [Clostridia bacterium]
MNSKEILEAARKNKERGKEFETKEINRSNSLGLIAAMVVGLVLYLLEFFLKGTMNIGIGAFGMTAAGVQSLYEGIRLKRTSIIIAGIIVSLLAVLLIIMFIIQVVSK